MNKSGFLSQTWVLAALVLAAGSTLGTPSLRAQDAAKTQVEKPVTAPDTSFGAGGTRTTTSDPNSKVRREAITDGKGHTVERRVYEGDGSIAYGFFDPGNNGKLAFEMFLAPQLDVTTSYTSEVLPVYHPVPTGKWNLVVTFHNGKHHDVDLTGRTRAEADHVVKKWEQTFAREIAH